MADKTIDLMCYAWEVAKRVKDNDSLTSVGAKILKHCFDVGASIVDAAAALDKQED